MTRQRLILAGAVLLALVGSFGVGRYSSRPPVLHDETHVKKDTAINDKLDVAMAEVIGLKRDLATWQAKASSASTDTTIVTKWLPAVPAANGCPAIPAHVEQATSIAAKSEEHSTGGSKASSASTKDLKAKKTLDHAEATHETVVTLHTVEARPSWSVSLLPGVQFAGAKAVDLYGPAVLGLAVERRILGPVWLGVWGSTSGASGITVKGEF